MKIPTKINFKFLASHKFQLFFVWLLLNLIILLVVIGYSVTKPVRNEIAFGVNFSSEDGINYTLRAFELMGQDKSVSCQNVQNKFNEWAEFEDRPLHKICQQLTDSYSQKRATYIQNQLYGPRLIYPYLISITYPLIGINSIVWIPIVIFFLVLNLQFFLFKGVTKHIFIPAFALLITLSSKHLLELSLSTASTDIIQALLVMILIVALCTKTPPPILALITLIVAVLSTFNKQSQVFWLIFAFILYLFSVKIGRASPEVQKRLRIVSLLNILLQPISFLIVENYWNSFSGGKNIGIFPVLNFDNSTNVLLHYFSILSNVLVNDVATIITKDTSTLLIFSAFFFAFYYFFFNGHLSQGLDPVLKTFVLVSFAVLLASVGNAIIIGHGNIYLRMYLSFLVLGFGFILIALTCLLNNIKYKKYLFNQ